MGFRQGEERSVDRVGADRLLEGFHFPSLVGDARIHSLNVEEECVGDRKITLHRREWRPDRR